MFPEQSAGTCAVIARPVYRASLPLSMIKIELYQISLSLGRGRSGYEIKSKQKLYGVETSNFHVFGLSDALGYPFSKVPHLEGEEEITDQPNIANNVT